MNRLLLSLLLAPLLAPAGELSNRPAPAFRLLDATGRAVSLADYKGKFLVVEFMNTTCPHCQKFAPVLESVHTRFKGKVGVVAISTHPDNIRTVTEFAKTYKASFPILVDPQNTAARDYLQPGPPNFGFSIPHLFLIDSSGFIRDDFSQNASNSQFFTPEGFARLVQGYVGR